MSSTKRSNSREFHISDFYITPQEPIRQFLEKFLSIETLPEYPSILDPSAGGNDKYDMPYPTVLKKLGINCNNLDTLDIRDNSKAYSNMNYLDSKVWSKYDLIITNPPFNLALDFITKALDEVTFDGFVIMLLRLNFFGSQSRKKFFAENMSKYCFVHSKRISFFPEDFELDGKVYKKGSTDSIEYAHFVWQKNYKQDYCKTYVI